MLTDFETKDLLVRLTEKNDTRAKNIVLTSKGRDFVQQLEQQLRQDLHVFLEDVALDDLTIYLRVLHKIANKFENGY